MKVYAKSFRRRPAPLVGFTTTTGDRDEASICQRRRRHRVETIHALA